MPSFQSGAFDNFSTDANNIPAIKKALEAIDNNLELLRAFGVGRDDLKTLSGQKIDETNTKITKRKGMITYVGVISSSGSGPIRAILPDFEDLAQYDAFILKDESKNASDYNITLDYNGHIVDCEE